MSETNTIGLNYGRSIPSITAASVAEQVCVPNEQENVPKTISSPVQLNENEKKKSFFEKPVVSKELFTEINLFVPQIIGFVFSILIGLAVIIITRFMGMGLVDSVKDVVTEEMYNQLANNMNIMNSFIMLGVSVPILIYFFFLVVKFFFLMPRKDRNIVVRIFNARAILFSIENVKAKMLFNPKDKKTEVMIDNPSKHYDYLNGRPVVFLGQEDRTNVSVIREDIDPSGKGRDIDSMVGNALHTGYEIAREQLAQRDDKTKIIIILLVVILAGLALVGFGVMRIPDSVIQGVVSALGAVSTAPKV